VRFFDELGWNGQVIIDAKTDRILARTFAARRIGLIASRFRIEFGSPLSSHHAFASHPKRSSQGSRAQRGEARAAYH
jgi:hypothetical protein